MFFVTILIKNTACRITPIYRLEAGSGGAGGGGAGGGEPGGGGAGGGGAGGGGAGGWRIIFSSNLQNQTFILSSVQKIGVLALL